MLRRLPSNQIRCRSGRGPREIKAQPLSVRDGERLFFGMADDEESGSGRGIADLRILSYPARNPVVHKWQANKRLFSEQAAAFLAGEICSDQRPVDEVLKALRWPADEAWAFGPRIGRHGCMRAFAQGGK